MQTGVRIVGTILERMPNGSDIMFVHDEIVEGLKKVLSWTDTPEITCDLFWALCSMA